MSIPAKKRIKGKLASNKARNNTEEEETIIVIEPTPPGQEPDFIIEPPQKKKRARKKKKTKIIKIKTDKDDDDSDFKIDRRPRRREEFGVKSRKPRNVRFCISFSHRYPRKMSILG